MRRLGCEPEVCDKKNIQSAPKSKLMHFCPVTEYKLNLLGIVCHTAT